MFSRLFLRCFANFGELFFAYCRIFGAMKVPTKRILKMMAELFDHEDVNVRTSSKVLTLELYEGIEIEPMKSMVHI